MRAYTAAMAAWLVVVPVAGAPLATMTTQKAGSIFDGQVQDGESLTVEVKDAAVTKTVVPLMTTQLLVGDLLVGDPIETRGEIQEFPESPAKVLLVRSTKDLDKCIVKLRCRTAEVKTSETGVYVIDKPGEHEVEVNVISQDPFEWDDKIVTVVVGGDVPPDPPPGPGPDPVPPTPPDVPEDEFDNLGQRVAGWAAGLQDLSVLAAIYREYAERMVSDQTQTAGSLSKMLVDEVAAMPNSAAYSELRKNINADLHERWSGDFDRQWLADYYLAIAAGLDGANQ